jgi:ABC-type branched-subunit amino acid transport system substrate-binding protein
LRTGSSTFALFGCMGTPMIEALLPVLKDSGVPLFAPLTGASTARPADMRNVLNVRAGYARETEHLVEHLATIGLRRVALAAQHNAFGDEIVRAAHAAAARHGLGTIAIATVESDGSDAAAAAAALAAAQPEAVLVGLAGKPAVDFVHAIRRERDGMPLYALSVMSVRGIVDALGADAYGITVTQVVPQPDNIVIPVVRDFLQAWRAQGHAEAPSHLALEGYIDARVFAEALRRCGPRPTRAAFVDAAYGIRRFDLGGFDVSFAEPGRDASRFIELTMIGRDGRFIR